MIYIVRHGQTNYNLENRYMGQMDIPLNETGIKEALKLKGELKEIKFDKVFSSPLIRAYKTAQIITDEDIVVDNRLIERGNGKLEGKLKSEINSFINNNQFNELEYGIEPLVDFRKRVYSFFDDITKLEGNILIVTHGGVSISARYYFEGPPKNNDVSLYILNNCEYIKYDNKEKISKKL